MPQILLQCTQNVIEKNISPLLKQIHEILVENLPTQINSCKTRAMRLDEYLVGDGAPENAFVHLSIMVLPGRSTETLQKTSEILMEALKKAFQESGEKLKLQITIAMQNLPEVYLKYQ